MSAKLVKVVEEKGSKTLASGSVLHKYVADLIVDGAAVNGAKVAVWGNEENTQFRAGADMNCRVKDGEYGTEYNLSGLAKAASGGGKAGGSWSARPPRFEDSEAGFYARQRGIVWCNALTAAVAALGIANGAEATLDMARAFYKAALAEVGIK